MKHEQLGRTKEKSLSEAYSCPVLQLEFMCVFRYKSKLKNKLRFRGGGLHPFR